jgi:hypothetical protein
MSRLKENIGTLISTKRCVTQGKSSDLYAISVRMTNPYISIIKQYAI